MSAPSRVRGRRTALYRLYDIADRLLYIGIAVNPPARWTGHAREKLWWQEVARITIEWYDTWELAEEAERKAIKVESPTHNVADTPDTERGERLARAANQKARASDLRKIRLDDDLWDAFGRATAKNGTNRSAVLRQLMLWFTHEPGATKPPRPETPTPLIADRDQP